MWNYLYFMVYLWEQDKDDDDGLEQFVRRCVEKQNLSWFPIGFAYSLESGDAVDSSKRFHMKSQVASLQSGLTEKLKTFESDLTTSVENLLVTISKAGNNKSAAANKDGEGGLGTGEDDNDSVGTGGGGGGGGGSVVSVNLNTCGLASDKMLSLRLLALSDIGVPDDELMQITCRIVCDAGMYAINASKVEDSTIYFDPIEYLICKNVTINDSRSFRVQILHGDSRVARFLAMVDFDYRELVYSDGLSLEKYFSGADQKSRGILTVAANCANISQQANSLGSVASSVDSSV
jgi:hypothetical protein